MECIKCKNEMTRAKLFMFGGMEIQSETKSVFETPETNPLKFMYAANADTLN
jgi:hypothetical protein